MVNYWLTITDETNWEIIQKNLVYAVKSKELLHNLSINDIFVMYLIPKRISGIFIVKNLKSTKHTMLNSKKYPYLLDINPLNIPSNPFEVSRKGNREFIDHISIFKNATRWGTILMGRSIIKITQQDYKYINEILKGVN